MVAHEQFFFDDGSTKGYGSTGMIVDGEDISDYIHLKYYDNNILQQAVDNIGDWKGSDYDFVRHNCQTYGEAVDTEYNRLKYSVK
jgi:hypothetical protein